MLTIDDIYARLGIDYPDEVVTKNATRAWRAAEKQMRRAIGDDVVEYLPDDPCVEELVLQYTEDLYDARGTSAKQASARSHATADLEIQLRAELARKREEGGGG